MAGVSREEFLSDLRRTLGKSGPSQEPDYLPLRIRREDQRQKVVTIEARAQARRADLLNQLSLVASGQGWKVHRATSAEEVVGYVVDLAREKGAGLIVRSNHEVFKRLPLDAALRKEGARVVTAATSRSISREQLREEMAQADLGITGVDYAIGLLADEMARTMALLGCRTVAQLGHAHLTRA